MKSDARSKQRCNLAEKLAKCVASSSAQRSVRLLSSHQIQFTEQITSRQPYHASASISERRKRIKPAHNIRIQLTLKNEMPPRNDSFDVEAAIGVLINVRAVKISLKFAVEDLEKQREQSSMSGETGNGLVDTLTRMITTLEHAINRIALVQAMTDQTPSQATTADVETTPVVPTPQEPAKTEQATLATSEDSACNTTRHSATSHECAPNENALVSAAWIH